MTRDRHARPGRRIRRSRALELFAGVLLVLSSCSAPATDPPDDPGETDEPDEPEIDCDVEPVLPADYQILEGFGSGEDFDFDASGRHGSVEGGILLLRTIDGEFEVFLPGIGDGTTGTRQLPSGDWVVAVTSTGDLLRVTSGGTEVLLSGLSYPNGVEVDPDGYVYVSENSGERVQRVHADTGESMVVAEGLDNPNSIIETADGDTLYIGTCSPTGWFGRGLIYAIERTGPDSWAEPEIIFESEGQGCIDALNVDACGRLYFFDYTDGFAECTAWRLHLDSGEIELAVEVSGRWVSNMRWGHDIGGWSSTTLYACDRLEEALFAIELGVPGKPPVLDHEISL